VTVDQAGTPDIKAYLGDADTLVDKLPWKVGPKPVHHRLARGRASALAHQVAGMLAGGFTVDELRAALDAVDVTGANDPAAQEKLWRGGLKKAKNDRARQDRAHDVQSAS
jgi:hypothetical protein